MIRNRYVTITPKKTEYLIVCLLVHLRGAATAQRPSYRPYYYRPYYHSSSYYVPPAYVVTPGYVYSAPPGYSGMPPAPQLEREVVIPEGRYLLQGDGDAVPYRGAWLSNPPPAPPADTPDPR